jgi:long-chain acyl-CoA synthetase
MPSSGKRTLARLFIEATEQRGKPDCFLRKLDGRYQPVSSQDALRMAAAVARALDRMGIRRGDRVALLSENRLEWALTDYAILGLGAVTVPLYPTLLEPDIEHILRDSASRGIIVSSQEHLQKVLGVKPRLADLGFILVLDGDGRASPAAELWSNCLQEELAREPDPVSFYLEKAGKGRDQDIASILYTSGTTGTPKGVVLTHANIVSNLDACRDRFVWDMTDIAMSFLPLSHIFERMLDFYCLHRGVSIAYAENLESLPQNLQEVRPTVMAVVPRVLEKVHGKVSEKVRAAPPARQKLFRWAIDVGKSCFRLKVEGHAPSLAMRAKHWLAEHLVFSKIRGQMGGRLKLVISGAAPLSRELAEFFFAIGLPVYEGYGLTETSPVISVNWPGGFKLGTVGQVVPGVEVRLGEEFDDVEGKSGQEILVRGPNVMSGYYRLDDENRQAFDGGWFRTGDLGALDADGYLSITGRRKNLFKTSGGKYVSPERLENLFQGHRYVAQLTVIGEARKFVGALVVPNFPALEAYGREHGVRFESRGDLVREKMICDFMQQQMDEACQCLPPHERIRQIVLLAREFTIGAGELSATLKIKRRVVEDRYQDLIEEMFQRRAPEGHNVASASAVA